MLPKLPGACLLGCNTAVLSKWKEMVALQADLISDKGELLNQVKGLLGTSSEVDQLIMTMLDFISNSNDLTERMPEYFELLEEQSVEGKRSVTKQLTTLLKENEKLDQELNDRMEIYRASAEATKKTYAHTGDVAYKIVTEYANKHPLKLNETNCIRGVKTLLDRLISDEMSKPENYKKANLPAPPTLDTITKYRRKAFSKLNFK